MDRKIIDYIVVEVIKPDYEEYTYYYSRTYKGEGLNVASNIKNIEDEILIQENKKTLLEEEIKYVDNLLSTVEDFSTYKVTENEILFYNEKYINSHPLQYSRSLDEEYRIELTENIKKNRNEIESVDKKNASAKNEIKKLKIKESAILENNKSLDFETFRTDFEKSVLHYLEKGYEPQGGVSVSKNNSNNLVYCQAMVKYN